MNNSLIIVINSDGSGTVYDCADEVTLTPVTILTEALAENGNFQRTPLDPGICRLIRDGLAMDLPTTHGSAA